MCAEMILSNRMSLDPVELLRVFIQVEEENLELARHQLKKEHESVMAERAKLSSWQRPMDAPCWLLRFRAINMRKQALEAARTKLRELEKQRAE